MIGVCPQCLFKGPLLAFMVEPEARELVAALPALPNELQPRFLRYLGLFATPGRVVALKKATRLLAELAGLVQPGQIHIRGQEVRPAPARIWAVALDEIVAHPPSALPLTNHNYLKKIVWTQAADLAAQRESAAEAKRRAVKYSEEDSRQESTGTTSLAMVAHQEIMAGMKGLIKDPQMNADDADKPSEDQRAANKQRVADLIKGLGKHD